MCPLTGIILSCSTTLPRVMYRVGHLFADLGWVDLDLECFTIMLGQ